MAEATSFAVASPGSGVRIAQEFVLPDGTRLTPYSPKNNLIVSGCVLLPSRPEPYGDKSELVAAIRNYLRRYVDLSPTFEAICAHYALLSWVYDAFNEAPYLRFRGDYGTGKTRALLALGSICYKPFFASGASTVSPIFHILDTFQGTLVLDEADFRFSDATAGLTKILNNGNVAGLPVLRTMTNRHKELNPQAFRVFGPKLVAMRERFTDPALESRFLTEETGLRALRPEIPLQLPSELGRDALELRNRLLSWRLAERSRITLDPSRAVRDLEPRLNQVALPLLSLVDDPDLRNLIANELRATEGQVRQDRAASLEAAAIATLLELLDRSAGQAISVSAITAALKTATQEHLGRPTTPKWTGWFLRRRLKLRTERSGGVFVVPPSERAKLELLARRFGVAPQQA